MSKPTNIINKVYVINSLSTLSQENWLNMKVDFSDTNLELNKWNFEQNYDKNKLNKLKETNLCKVLCSPQMINSWLSHILLWEHIVKNNEDKVLILEDTVMPVKYFDKKLNKYWSEIPGNWDIVYFGCSGTCDLGAVSTEILSFWHGRNNKNIYKNGKLCKHVISPALPTGLYAYMISNRGAKKLLKQDFFNKISLSPEYNFPAHIMKDPSFNVYAFIPPLITKNSVNINQINKNYQDDSSQNQSHKVLSPILSKIKVSNDQSLQQLLNYEAVNYRPFNLTISYFSLILLITSFIIGLTGKNNAARVFVVFLVFLQLFELAFTNTNSDIVKTLFFEFIMCIIFLLLGRKIHLLYIKKKPKTT